VKDREVPHGCDHSGMADKVIAIDCNPVKMLTDLALARLHLVAEG
jgi:putative peptide zinc metalloprotease protein